MFKTEIHGQDLIIKNLNCFDINLILDCGQAFRWKKIEDNTWEGIAFSKYLKLKQIGNSLIFYNTTLKEFNSVWKDYFDIERNYNEIIKLIKTETLKTAAEHSSGIRILRQEPWEALCSFIISQNNNIPRIKGIIERLCENFGQQINGGFSFPSPKTISVLTPEDLAVLRCGFRAKYIIDAAKKVSDNTINLTELKDLPFDTAKNELLKIYGVGSKVADCALLYGLGHLAAFPKDVWINRALDVLFNGHLPESQSEYAGIYQQYIFYYARYINFK